MPDVKVNRGGITHNKKGQKRRKKVTRLYGGGFLERVRNPKVRGKSVKSVNIRVDAGFAEWVRQEAKDSGNSITDITRNVREALRGESLPDMATEVLTLDPERNHDGNLSDS